MANMEDNKLNYGFAFKKRGLPPKEFEDCLRQKVEKLFEHAKLINMKTVTKKPIKKVKQLCMRKNETRRGMDQKYPGVEINIDKGILRNPEDDPEAHNQDSKGTQGQVKKEKEWQRKYHELQHQLFTGPLNQKMKSLFPTIVTSDDTRKKGYLFHSAEEGCNKLTTTEFCNVIDGVTYDLLQNVTALKNHQPMPDNLDFEKVKELCEGIVVFRNAEDWVIPNDLMKEKETQIWRVHLLVNMSFAALMVVSLMILTNPFRSVRRYLSRQFGACSGDSQSRSQSPDDSS